MNPFHICLPVRITDLDLSNFETSKVTNVTYMFKNSSSLVNLNANGWDITNVTLSTDIFSGVDAGFQVVCDQGSGDLFGETCN